MFFVADQSETITKLLSIWLGLTEVNHVFFIVGRKQENKQMITKNS